MLFIDVLKKTEIFKALKNLNLGDEGNILQAEGNMNKLPECAEAQIEAIRYTLAQYVPMTDPVILETGTNKGMFCLIMTMLQCSPRIYTFDGNPKSEEAVINLNELDILNPPKITFVLGDTNTTLPKFVNAYVGPQIGLAWVDGGHDYDTCLADIVHCSKLEIPVIMVDDTKTHKEVRRAVDSFLSLTSKYIEAHNPFIDYDYRGAVILVDRGLLDV